MRDAAANHKQQPHDGPRSSAVAVVALVAGLIWIAGLLAFWNRSGELSGGQPETSQAVRSGVACTAIQDANEYFEKGRFAEFQVSIGEATGIAIHSLNSSEESFGLPERLALRLGATIRRKGPEAAEVRLLMTRARQTCQQAGRWPFP